MRKTTSSTSSTVMSSRSYAAYDPKANSNFHSQIEQQQSETKINLIPNRSAQSNLKLECMYTKHLVKKRKAWSDGYLKVHINNGIYECSLIDAGDVREIPLQSRLLEPPEIKLFQSRLLKDISMDDYLIEVTYSDSCATSSIQLKSGADVKLMKKFVPPSRYIPPNRPSLSNNPIPSSNRSQEPSGTVPAKLTTRGQYTVDDDELDSIWNAQLNGGLSATSANNLRIPTKPTTQESSISCQASSNLRGGNEFPHEESRSSALSWRVSRESIEGHRDSFNIHSHNSRAAPVVIEPENEFNRFNNKINKYTENTMSRNSFDNVKQQNEHISSNPSHSRSFKPQLSHHNISSEKFTPVSSANNDQLVDNYSSLSDGYNVSSSIWS